MTNTPKPPDAEISAHLLSKFQADERECQHVLGELYDTVEYTNAVGEPEIFAYGRLRNYLTETCEHDYLIQVCAAALYLLHGQYQPKLYAIKTDKEDGSNRT